MAYSNALPSRDLFGNVHVAPEPPAVRRSRLTNDPTTRCNQATPQGRRVNDLIRALLQGMGNPTDTVAQSAAISAAELVVAAEDARAKLLAGNGDPDQVVRLENLAHRAVRKLGLDRQHGGKPKQTLAEYLREKSAAPSAEQTKASAV